MSKHVLVFVDCILTIIGELTGIYAANPAQSNQKQIGQAQHQVVSFYLVLAIKEGGSESYM
eukprot:scaffold9135_cov102-Cylindrotheca_fusiformis.AAC.2